MKSRLIKEIKEHIPFTLVATVSAIALVIFIQFIISKNISEESFEIFHPLHIIASAIVTSGIFYKYKKKPIQAILIGILGSVTIGTISDVIFPFLGGNILNLETRLHIPIFEETFKILLFALIGGIIGTFGKITKIPHFVHVFLSIFASLFYLMAFSQTFNTIHFIISVAIVFTAVLIPCCISDIIFPLIFLEKKRQ